jgi:plastocyanin
VIAQEYSFTLSRPVVPAGPVVVEFVNRGQDAHNLHLDNAAEAGEASAFPNTESEAHESLHFNLRAGSYKLFCSLPKHEELGMKATLTVQ